MRQHIFLMFKLYCYWFEHLITAYLLCTSLLRALQVYVYQCNAIYICSDAVVSQVLDELGLQMADTLSGNMSTSLAFCC